jgi:hypothetical protein
MVWIMELRVKNRKSKIRSLCGGESGFQPVEFIRVNNRVNKFFLIKQRASLISLACVVSQTNENYWKRKSASIFPFRRGVAARGTPARSNPMKITPYSIQNIMEQLRHGMVGALDYVGGHELFFNHPPNGRDHECRSSFRSHVGENGGLKYEVGLNFRVNGKPGESWRMTVAYEPDDTYSVWLMRDSVRRQLSMPEVLANVDQVNSDDLQQAVESIYDEAIKASERDFVPEIRPLQSQFS